MRWNSLLDNFDNMAKLPKLKEKMTLWATNGVSFLIDEAGNSVENDFKQSNSSDRTTDDTNPSEVMKKAKNDEKKLVRLVLERGTLRYARENEFSARKKKGGMQDDNESDEIDMHFYKSATIDGRFEVVDLDKTSAWPLVRSILWQIGLYPELSVLRTVKNVCFVIVLILVVLYLRTGGGLKAEDYTKSQKDLVKSIEKICSPSDITPLIPQDLKKESIVEKSWSILQPTQKEDNKKSFNIFPIWAKN